MSLDIDTFRKRVERGRVFAVGSITRKISVISRYGEFIDSQGLEPDIRSLNLWIDEIMDGLADGALNVYAYDVLSYFLIMMMPQDLELVEAFKKRLPRVNLDEKDPEYLTFEEFDVLMANIPEFHHLLIFYLLYEYTRRPGEVIKTKASPGLCWKDVDFNNDTIRFYILKKRKLLPVTYDLRPYLKEHLQTQRKRILPSQDTVFSVKIRAVEYAFKRACERAGIEPNGRKLSPKILRHSRITHAGAQKIPIEVVSKHMARHARIETTMRHYRAIMPEEVQEIPSAEEVLRRRENKNN